MGNSVGMSASGMITTRLHLLCCPYRLIDARFLLGPFTVHLHSGPAGKWTASCENYYSRKFTAKIMPGIVQKVSTTQSGNAKATAAVAAAALEPKNKHRETEHALKVPK